MIVDVTSMGYREINQTIRDAVRSVTLTGCCGQRFIGAGMSGRTVTVEGVPGNALGAYLNGAGITVHANAQDAVGDTMNDGEIVIYGSVGDAVGYAMRGGDIYVKGNAGYRAGIHMKEYRTKVPHLVIGGAAGCFLGEYQAGGVIVVLGLGTERCVPVGEYPCTGMHGGKMYLRGKIPETFFPMGVISRPVSDEERKELGEYVTKYCSLFGGIPDEILAQPFTAVVPDSKNPYKQMYVAN